MAGRGAAARGTAEALRSTKGLVSCVGCLFPGGSSLAYDPLGIGMARTHVTIRMAIADPVRNFIVQIPRMRSLPGSPMECHRGRYGEFENAAARLRP